MRLVVVLAVVASLDGTVGGATAGTAPPSGPLVYTGEMGDAHPDARYPIVVQAGQEIRVSAVATSGNLDPYLFVEDPAGAVVSENDDRDATTLDSYLVHIAAVEGEHVVIVSNIAGTSGAYTVTIEVGGSIATITAATAALEYSGAMGDQIPDARYPFTLEAGRAVRITADTVSGDLDPIIWIEDAQGETVALNDDGDIGVLNADLAYVSPTSATYTLVVSNISPTSGEYRVTMYAVDTAETATVGRVSLTGPALVHDTTNFRIHYTTDGEDATTVEFAQLVGTTMEEVLQRQIALGWPLPPPDGAMGGDARFDVYLVDVITDDDEAELGHVAPELPERDNPNTAVIEEAAPSHIVLDNDFGEGEIDPGDDGVALMHATAAHEFHHAIQFGYDFDEPMQWYGEATAVWMETVTYPDFEDATGYVEGLFEYPELCLGVQGDADATDGAQKYGEWLFLQSLVDAHDPQLVVHLWGQIGVADGWVPLDRVLTAYGDTRLDAARRFRLQNLVRDYAWTPEFGTSTVWLEKTIDAGGQWTHGGDGVQQLGANYYGVNVVPGSYQFAVDDPALELWLVGISGPTASVFSAHGSRVVSVGGFDFAYLVVFNPVAGYDVEACQYTSYGLTVSRVGDVAAPGTADFTFDATQFAPLVAG